jgi:hypothetical protein
MTKDEVRRRAALQIDPETAQVHWKYAQTLDPYGDEPPRLWPVK